MTRIGIMVTRHAAFYAPVICAITGGFLREEGLEAEYAVGSPSKASESLIDGTVQVAQSAVSASWPELEQGVDSGTVHLAQINERDGFFIAAREPDPEFSWNRLSGREVLVDHGRQPIAMFKYAAHKMGLEFGAIQAIDAGGPDAIETAFRDGRGAFVHLQGPAPQQLQADGVGHVVASVGEAIGPVAFSSLRASRAWTRTEPAKAFIRAYRKARGFVAERPADEVAAALADMFPKIDRAVLARTVADYQALGCWAGDARIGRASYEAALEVFAHVGDITRRHPYEQVVVPPPDET